VKPGDKLAEGVVVKHEDAGVYVGRVAEEGEACPPRHTEHELDGVRVFLSRDQAPIPPAGLHPKKAASAPAAKKGKKS
jgi:hypothetical protein